MISNSGATLPRGRALVESYAFTQVQSDAALYGSLTYFLYGLTDRVTVGVKPFFGLATSADRHSKVGLGDLTLSLQYRLTNPRAASGSPAISLSLQRSLPTGRYDRLSQFGGSALGSGAETTTVALYGQQLFWLPNGRIFRGRINISTAWSAKTHVSGPSVYGTPEFFDGQARPGAVHTIGVSGEYSVSREVAIGLDVLSSTRRSTTIIGAVGSGGATSPFMQPSGAQYVFAVAPAVEYSWTANLGVLFAARYIPKTGATPASITPAVALNLVI